MFAINAQVNYFIKDGPFVINNLGIIFANEISICKRYDPNNAAIGK